MSDLKAIILKNAPILQARMPWANAAWLLGALAEVESTFGTNNVPRYEKAYDEGGIYYRRSPEVRARHVRWGDWAHCSYSSFQVMFHTACELGFRGTPLDLWKDEVAIFWVIEFIRKRAIEKGAKTLSEIFDAYNSGTHRDRIVPEEYIAKGLGNYQTVGVRRGLG